MSYILKSIAKGFALGIGFVLGLYVCSHIYLLGFEESIKEFSVSIGKMFVEIGS